MTGIAEFDISGKIASLESLQTHLPAQEYINKLKLFSENFSAAEIDIKKTFEKKDSACFAKCINSVKDMLLQISADLAAECDKLISASDDLNNEETEAQLTQFLSLLTVFSIDIQMALYARNTHAARCTYRHENPKSTGESNVNSSVPETSLQDTVGCIAEKDKIILAVDDSPYFLTALKNALSGTEYKLICVSLCSAALKFIEKQKPNLIILDIEMPEMNGYELAEKIREKEETSQLKQRTPIIFMTGNSAKEYVLKAIKAGAADFIVKPILPEYVLAKIRKYL